MNFENISIAYYKLLSTRDKLDRTEEKKVNKIK